MPWVGANVQPVGYSKVPSIDAIQPRLPELFNPLNVLTRKFQKLGTAKTPPVLESEKVRGERAPRPETAGNCPNPQS